MVTAERLVNKRGNEYSNAASGHKIKTTGIKNFESITAVQSLHAVIHEKHKMSASTAKPKSMQRAKRWSEEVEEG